MVFTNKRYCVRTFKCKFCDVIFKVYSKCWYHEKKCEIETKLANKINAAYEKLREQKEKEKEREKEKEMKEMNDEYTKITGNLVVDDCVLDKLLERIQNVRKKMRTEIIDLKYDEKEFDITRNRIHENRKKQI